MEGEDKSKLISNEVPHMCGAAFGYKGMLRMYFVRAIEDPKQENQTHIIFDEISGGEAELKSGDGAIFITFNDMRVNNFFKPEPVDSSDSLTFSEREEMANVVRDNSRSSRQWSQRCYLAEDFMLRSAAAIATYYMEVYEDDIPNFTIETKTKSVVIRGKPDTDRHIWVI